MSFLICFILSIRSLTWWLKIYFYIFSYDFLNFLNSSKNSPIIKLLLLCPFFNGDYLSPYFSLIGIFSLKLLKGLGVIIIPNFLSSETPFFSSPSFDLLFWLILRIFNFWGLLVFYLLLIGTIKGDRAKFAKEVLLSLSFANSFNLVSCYSISFSCLMTIVYRSLTFY